MAMTPADAAKALMLEEVNAKTGLALTPQMVYYSVPLATNPDVDDLSGPLRNTQFEILMEDRPDFRVAVNYNRLSINRLFDAISTEFTDNGYTNIMDLIPVLELRLGVTFDETDYIETTVQGTTYPKTLEFSAQTFSYSYTGTVTLTINEAVAPPSGLSDNMATWFWDTYSFVDNSWRRQYDRMGVTVNPPDADNLNSIDWEIGGGFTENITTRMQVDVNSFEKPIVGGQTRFETDVEWIITEQDLIDGYVRYDDVWLKFWYATADGNVLIDAIRLVDTVPGVDGEEPTYNIATGPHHINYLFPTSIDLTNPDTFFKLFVEFATDGTTMDVNSGQPHNTNYSALGLVTINPISRQAPPGT